MYTAIHAMKKIRPISPIRLYNIACTAAVFASARPYHQPMSKNDMMPTPSHPMKNWNTLFAVTRIIIMIRKIIKYLKNRSLNGSECMYQDANSKMDHVT